MSRIREQIDIEAAPEDVFAFFDDVANAGVLVPSLVALTSVEALPNGGRRVEYTTRNKHGEIVAASSEHLEYDAPHRTVTRGQQSGIGTVSTRHFVRTTGRGTRVVATIEWSVPVKYVAALITSPLRRPLRRSLRHSLGAAKAALESGPASLSSN
ncbi:MAG: SRPBCC family protein [Acidimicrobiia bacterium]|nr:SRPBCC family protein [Acidimicrobiia bacterium]